MGAQKSEEKWINAAAFFFFGFVKCSMEITVMTSAEDVLSGTIISSTMLILAVYAPHALFAAILPCFVGQIGQLVVSTTVFISFMVGLMLLALPSLVELRFLGAIILGIGVSVSDTLLLGLTARYSEITVHSFVAGTGVSGIFITLFYTGVTTLMDVSYVTTLLMLLALPPLVPIFHFLMEKKQPEQKVTGQSKIAYSALGSHEPDEPVPSIPCREKLKIMYNVRLLLFSLFIGYCCKDLTLMGIITTLAFPNAPFGPRDHYPYYILTYLVGEFLSKTYCFFASVITCTKMISVTKHTWMFSIGLYLIQLLLVFASWYHFLPNVYSLLAIVLVFGLTNGALYSSTFIVASQGSSKRDIEYSRAFLNIAVSVGVIVAGLVGLSTETELREHCVLAFPETSYYCFTRESE